MSALVHIAAFLGSVAATALAGFCAMWLLFRSRDWTD